MVAANFGPQQYIYLTEGTPSNNAEGEETQQGKTLPFFLFQAINHGKSTVNSGHFGGAL